MEKQETETQEAETQEAETQEAETQEAETQEAETQEAETQEAEAKETHATFNSLRSENEDREDLPRHFSSAESLEGEVASIRCEAENVFSTDQINSGAARLLKSVLAAINLCVDHSANSIDLPGSAARATANLKYLNSILVPLIDLTLWHEEPRNVFGEIHMGEYTLLGLLSPLAPYKFRTISSGSGGIQYVQISGQPGVDGVPERAIPIVSNGGDGVKNELTKSNLANSISRFIRKGYKLVRRSQIVFREIELGEREMMLILSCTTPIIVCNVRGKEGAVFIAGQVQRATIKWLCKELDVEFDSTQRDGVFQTELA